MNAISNPFQTSLAPKSSGGLVKTESAKAIEEIRAAMVIAKKFPCNEAAVFQNIVQTCTRPTPAAGGLYAYPRGGTLVTGSSIRLAEAMAPYWGNIQFGIRELRQVNGVSKVEAFAWDMQTNTRHTKVFQVKHECKAKGRIEKLTDPHDTCEHVANQGAPRLRACILGVIPGDVVEAAQNQCELTLENSDEPLEKRITKMVSAFSELKVSEKMIEKHLGHNIDVTTSAEIVRLQKIFRSIGDGMASVYQYFEDANVDYTKTKDLNEKADMEAQQPPKDESESSAPPFTKQTLLEEITQAKNQDDIDISLDLANQLPDSDKKVTQSDDV
jgi:hypothetical protein